ncbi:hypothetical protein ACWCPW_49740, partial [Embleya sp. NPDC001921]
VAAVRWNPAVAAQVEEQVVRAAHAHLVEPGGIPAQHRDVRPRRVGLLPRLSNRAVHQVDSLHSPADLLYGLLSPELYLIFVRDRGWSPDAWEEWARATLTTQLCTDRA